MTYQRNMVVLEDRVDQGLPDGVQQAEVSTGEQDEAEHDGRRLEDVLAVRTLHAAQLLDAGAQEGEDPPALLLRTRRRVHLVLVDAGGGAAAATPVVEAGGRLDRVRRTLEVVLAGEDVLVVEIDFAGLPTAGARFGGAGLVDVGGGVLERVRRRRRVRQAG